MADEIRDTNSAIKAAQYGDYRTASDFQFQSDYTAYLQEQEFIASRLREIYPPNKNIHSGSIYQDSGSSSPQEYSRPITIREALKQNLAAILWYSTLGFIGVAAGMLLNKYQGQILNLFKSESIYEKNLKLDQQQRAQAVNALGKGYNPEVKAQFKKIQSEQTKHVTAFQMGRYWAVLPPANQFNESGRILVCNDGFYMEQKFEISAFTLSAAKGADNSGVKVKSYALDAKEYKNCFAALKPEIQNYYGNVPVKVVPKLVVD